MLQIKNLFPDFLDFWKAAQGKNREEQLRLWQEVYEAKHPQIFATYFSAPYWGRHEALPEALRKYKEDINEIEKTTREIEKLIPGISERAQAAFATSEDEIEMDLIVFVGTYGADGFSHPVAHRMTIFLALEHLRDYEPSKMKALIAHELAHGFHWKLARRSYPEQFLRIARGLFEEGLAVAASKRIVPGFDEKIYLFYSLEQWGWCQENRQRLIEMVLGELYSGSQNTYNKFFTIWKPTEELLYHRTGYYVGSLAIEQMLKRYSLRELAETEPEEYPELIREALAENE